MGNEQLAYHPVGIRHLSPSQTAVTLYGLEGNRRSGIALTWAHSRVYLTLVVQVQQTVRCVFVRPDNNQVDLAFYPP